MDQLLFDYDDNNDHHHDAEQKMSVDYAAQPILKWVSSKCRMKDEKKTQNKKKEKQRNGPKRSGEREKKLYV